MLYMILDMILPPLTELQKISSFYAVKVENLEKLKQNIMEHLIPNVCEEAYDANYGTDK